MVRRLAVFVTVLLSIPAAVLAQSGSQIEHELFSEGTLARIRGGLATVPAIKHPLFERSLVASESRLQQPSAAEWQKEFDRTTALRRKSSNVMKLGLVLAGVGALSAVATPNAKGTMAIAMSTPGLGIATWGYLARRKGDKELKRLEGTRPAGVKTTAPDGKTSR